MVTSYKASVNIGGQMYSTSNYTKYNSAGSNYQWDGLNIYFGFPSCSAYATGDYYQVSIWDTASGAITSEPFLQFNVPGVGDCANYNSPSALVYVLDTAYSGNIFVSGSITKNGNHTCNGTFSLHGLVASPYSLDSISVSGTGTFTNLPYY